MVSATAETVRLSTACCVFCEGEAAKNGLGSSMGVEWGKGV